MAEPNDGIIGTLNSFLRGEISAVETYRQALEECEQDHQQRINLLRLRITELGGEPTEGSGVWGAWAKVVQGGGNLLGEKKALDTLEAGEDHGLDDYRRDLDALDGETRAWIEANILPKAERTHGAMSLLKRTLH
jgi:demethoxyubiquinone hydroxylase (CLK1/Coq7/Cat5 family)